MLRNRTIGQKLAWAFALVLLLTAVVAGVAIRSLESVEASQTRLIEEGRELTLACRLGTAAETELADTYGYLASNDDAFLDDMRRQEKVFADGLADMRKEVDDSEGKRLLDEIERTETEHEKARESVVKLRQSGVALESVQSRMKQEQMPSFAKLEQKITEFTLHEQTTLEHEQQRSRDTATEARRVIIGVSALALLIAAGLAFFLTRGLTRQIGGAVQHLQSSTAELQSAASQQATGSKEQASATSEVSTTLKELVATARQIGESAQHVVRLAEATRVAAKGGDQTGILAQEAVATTKRQVDLIVNHMLELGKKSQQIGNVLEIVNELAEQTNILSINATIEAAGAGEAGKRFASVADEIRKLADRTAGSTKEIRALIDEIRAGVNTTVMATETGSKAADAGAKQLIDVTGAFAKIGETILPTTQAAREIELSTKQQATAVEQVNVAVASVAQAARETETSTTQTLQAASQLAVLAKELTQLIGAQAAR